MSAALQIWSHTCCKAFDQLPAAIQESVQRKVDEMGMRLGSYPHHRLTGRSECRLRAGDYRVLYELDVQAGTMSAIAVKSTSAPEIPGPSCIATSMADTAHPGRRLAIVGQGLHGGKLKNSSK